MKRKLSLTQLLALGVAIAAPTGVIAAGLDSSHHDMLATLTSGPGVLEEKCAFCHSKTGVTTSIAYGAVGGFCVTVCHMNPSAAQTQRPFVVPDDPGYFTLNRVTSALDTTLPAASPSILAAGHGFVINSIPAPDTAAAVNQTGWPHTSDQDFEMECTSCHAVHDPTNPPFLNAPLSSDSATPNSDSFCQRCHNDGTGLRARAQDFSIAGNHPTEFIWNQTDALARNTAKTGSPGTIMMPRRLRSNAEIPVMLTRGMTGTLITDYTWNTGGHVLDTASVPRTPVRPAAPGQHQFGCYSCHTVHTSKVTMTGNYVAGAAVYSLLPANSIHDICYGCHGGTGNVFDPGATGFGHPIDIELVSSYDNHNWNIPLSAEYVALRTPAGSADDYAPDPVVDNIRAPYCVSCHDVHNARPSLMAIRSIKGTETPTQSVCLSCHEASFDVPPGTATSSHHPGKLFDGSNATNYVFWGFDPAAAWTTIDNNGNLTDGLSCPDCHTGSGSNNPVPRRSTAHNWPATNI